RWTGRISLDAGTLNDLQLLGMDADAAAAIWLDGRQIRIEPRSAHLSDGVDVTVAASSAAKLTISLKGGPDSTPVQTDVTLAKRMAEPIHLPLDAKGNEITIQRAPGDALRINANRNDLIFVPGEKFAFDLQALLDGLEPSTTIDIEATLSAARSATPLWTN